MLRKTLLILLLSAGCLTAPMSPLSAAANEDNLVQLDGSGSEDADGDRLIYSWRQLSGPRVDLLNADTAKPSFYAQTAGDYSFELTVSDGRSKSEPAIVNLVIEEANEIPIAVLPPRISIELGEQVILDGTASNDADQDSLLYNFSQISGPIQVLNSTVSQEPTYTVVPHTIGTYSFELVVNDGRANSKPALCIVDVVKPNSAPIAKVTAPKKAIINTRHSFSTPAVTVTQIKRPQITPGSKTELIPELSEKKPSTHKLQPKVKLAHSRKLPKMVQEIDDLDTIQPLNITPIASTSGDIVVTPGSKVVIKGFGVDPDGDSLQFIWNQTSGPIIPGSPVLRKNLAFIPRKEGTYVFSLVVNDGKAKSDPATCAVTVRSDSSAKITPASLDNPEVAEDINSLELSIPKEDKSVQAQVSSPANDDDISFRELFSID